MVEAESVLEIRRPRVPFVISRSFEGLRCDKGMLCSFALLSLRGLFSPSYAGVHAFFCGLYLGMRLDTGRGFEESEVLFDNEGNEGAGEPDDRGWDTQSSESESNQACSIMEVGREVESKGVCDVYGCDIGAIELLF